MSKSKAYENWVHIFAETSSKLEVGSEADAARASIVVCRLKTEPLLMPDNKVATCAKCFRAVQLRPHVPEGPKKMCDECAGKEIAKRQKKGKPVGYIITEKTAADVERVLHRKRMN